MADNREAMEDLQRILQAREPLYRKADLVIDTSGHSIEEALQVLSEARQAITASQQI
jgi:XRE family aerobic/anaerobic benzoate catabolism transcriptional regulator